jgi:hypothetical protein
MSTIVAADGFFGPIGGAAIPFIHMKPGPKFMCGASA